MEKPPRKRFTLLVVLFVLTELLLLAAQAARGEMLQAIPMVSASAHTLPSFQRYMARSCAEPTLWMQTKNKYREIKGCFCTFIEVEEQDFIDHFSDELQHYIHLPNSHNLSMIYKNGMLKRTTEQEIFYQRKVSDNLHSAHELTLDGLFCRLELGWLHADDTLLFNGQLEIISPIDHTLAIWAIWQENVLLLKIKLHTAC